MCTGGAQWEQEEVTSNKRKIKNNILYVHTHTHTQKEVEESGMSVIYSSRNYLEQGENRKNRDEGKAFNCETYWGEVNVSLLLRRLHFSLGRREDN